MGISLSDVLNAGFVFVGIDLLADEEQFQSFSAKLDEELVVELPTLDIGLEARTITINKDRISLRSVGGRSLVQQEFPTKESLPKLCEVASMAIAHTPLTADVSAIGYNVQLVYKQDDRPFAFTYIAERVLRNFRQADGWRITGGHAALRFVDADERVWNVSVEPRLRRDNTDKVFLSLNLHIPSRSVPPADELRNTLETTWDEAVNIAHALDAAEVSRQ